MSNEFSKEEIVQFENVVEGFQDALVASKNVNTYGTSGQLMERSNDTIWRPQQYISVGGDRIVGSAVSAKNKLQMSVPASLTIQPNDTFELDALEMRDALQEGRLGMASAEYLASRINTDVLTVATMQGTLVTAVSGAAGQYDDVALCDSLMNEQGVRQDQRFMMFNSRDYNGMASDLAARQTMTGLPEGAYRDSYVGRVSSFETFKLDSGRRIAAAAGGATNIDTQASASNYYVPVATRTDPTYGNTGNVDNRYQTITVDNSVGVVAGDAFTIAGVNAVHHINKTDTGQAKTFRVISVPTGTTLVISPPIISNQGGSDAEEAYQNCVVTPSASAAFNWLNDNATGYNVFWRKPAIELLPGRYAVPTGQGAAVRTMTTDNGIEIVATKKFDPSTFKTVFTFDARYGVVMTDPEQCGVLLFNQ